MFEIDIPLLYDQESMELIIERDGHVTVVMDWLQEHNMQRGRDFVFSVLRSEVHRVRFTFRDQDHAMQFKLALS